MRIFSAEWLKTRRTSARLLIFCTPVAFALLVIGYVSLEGIDEHIQTRVFEIFFEAWAACIIPVYVGVLTGITVHQEELAGNFSGLLLNSVSRHRLYWAKLLMLLLSTGISTTTAVLTVGVGFKIILGVSMNWIIFISAAVFTVIGTIPLLALHLWAGFKWGMGTSIGIGAAGLLVAALMGVTVLGDKVWQFVPWTWPVRLSMLCGIYLQFIENMQASLDIINLGFISKQLTTGLMSVLFCFAVAGTGGTIWFNRWEGRKSYE